MSDSCILCGARAPFARVSPRLRDSESHEVLRCLACSHHQISPLPDPAEEQAFYDVDSQTKNLGKEIDLGMLSRKKYHDTARRVEFLRAHGIQPNASLLDVGSGYGIFLAEAYRVGYRAVGLEVSRERRELAASLTEAPILDVNLMQKDEAVGSFDAITLFHVIEHLANPQALIRRLTKHLSPGGALIFEAPNLGDFMLSICSSYRRFYWQRAHLSYFTEHGLRAVLEQSGCRHVEIFGLQRYGLSNMRHWLIHGTPQVEEPSFESLGMARQLERKYKHWLERNLRCDTLMAIARVAT